MKRPDPTRTSQEVSDEPGQRRPYEPPAIEESAEFETLALACGLSTSTQACIRGGGLQFS